MATVTLSAIRLKPPAALVLHLLALAACGGKADEVATGLPSSAVLGELTTEDATAGCGGIDALVARRFDQLGLAHEQCTLFALERTSEVAPCIALRDTCEMNRAENQPSAVESFFEPARDLGCGDTSISWRGCTATVRALEACLHDLLDEYEDALETFTCKDAPTYRGACLPPINPYVGVDEVDPRTWRPFVCELVPMPESCWALEGSCASLPLLAR